MLAAVWNPYLKQTECFRWTLVWNYAHVKSASSSQSARCAFSTLHFTFWNGLSEPFPFGPLMNLKQKRTFPVKSQEDRWSDSKRGSLLTWGHFSPSGLLRWTRKTQCPSVALSDNPVRGMLFKETNQRQGGVTKRSYSYHLEVLSSIFQEQFHSFSVRAVYQLLYFLSIYSYLTSVANRYY